MIHPKPSVPNFPSVCLSWVESLCLRVCRDIYFLFPAGNVLFWVFHLRLFLFKAHKLLWLLDRAKSADIWPQTVGFVFNPIFGAFPAAGLYFFPLMGKYTTYDKDFPVFKPFLSLRLFIKSAREVTYKPSVFLVCLAFNARIYYTVCRVSFVRF